ncbi:hypothetical protein ACFELO_09260 [Oceanicaulis sp. LC35]|uniref:hypothetical protein n=1 Tax=Oceanicaulis sp. LC35 TaxID=3349635 RepID=UPI003F86075C
MRLTYTLITAAALTVTACAGGPPEGRGAHEGAPGINPARVGGIVTPASLVVASFDASADAVVTAAEVRTGAERVFLASDQDSNGGLSGIEISGFSQRHLGAQHAIPGRIAFDPNGDAVTTLEEFTAVWIAEFTRLDTNADGAVTREEMIRQVSMSPSGQGRPGGGRGGRGGPGGGGRGPGGPG